MLVFFALIALHEQAAPDQPEPSPTQPPITLSSTTIRYLVNNRLLLTKPGRILMGHKEWNCSLESTLQFESICLVRNNYIKKVMIDFRPPPKCVPKCQNNGECRYVSATNSTTECHCGPGWSGAQCQTCYGRTRLAATETTKIIHDGEGTCFSSVYSPISYKTYIQNL